MSRPCVLFSRTRIYKYNDILGALVLFSSKKFVKNIAIAFHLWYNSSKHHKIVF